MDEYGGEIYFYNVRLEDTLIRASDLSSSEYGSIKLQTYNYEVDNVQKEIIDDDFYAIIGFNKSMKIIEKIYNITFYFCDLNKYYEYARNESIQWLMKDIFDCYQSVQFQFSSGFKPPNRMFRYRDENFQWFCKNIYQDVVKTSFGVKGTLVNGCQIPDIDMVDITKKAIDFLLIDMSLSSIESFGEIANDVQGVLLVAGSSNNAEDSKRVSCVQNVDMQVGVIQDAFSKYSWSSQVTIIPDSLKKAVVGNLSTDVNFSCQVDHEMVIGNVTLREKNITFYNLGELNG